MIYQLAHISFFGKSQCLNERQLNRAHQFRRKRDVESWLKPVIAAPSPPVAISKLMSTTLFHGRNAVSTNTKISLHYVRTVTRRADQEDIDRKSLRLYKANLRFIHDKFTQLELDVLFEAYKSDPKRPTLWPSFMRILLGRILDAGYIECHGAGTRDNCIWLKHITR